MMSVICVTIYTVAHSCTFFTDTQVTNHVPINFFFSAQMAFQEEFFVPQLTQTTKKLLLLNIACC